MQYMVRTPKTFYGRNKLLIKMDKENEYLLQLLFAFIFYIRTMGKYSFYIKWMQILRLEIRKLRL